ncbi:MAG: gephyrin-like molybdotransferase Glp [Verrucomicrobiota bacterium]
MLELTEARNRIVAAIQPLGFESVPLFASQGRFAADTITSPIDLPIFDNSAMDGYTVQAEDLASASPEHPVCLQLEGEIAAGAIYPGDLASGKCVRLFTGSRLPRGSNAVVMQEEVRIDPKQASSIWFSAAAQPWENVRLRGEDVKRGAVLVQKGMRLTVGRISLLAAVGLTTLSVGRQPNVGLLATGSELQEGGQPLGPGEIYESNRVGLSFFLAKLGGKPAIYPLIKDNLAATQAALETAFRECDIVITSGGVSVGEFDFVKTAFQSIGGNLDFWKVAIRPGKPFVFGQRKEKFLFGLPGNPVSAMVTCLVLVQPAVLRLQGASNAALPDRWGILAETLSNHGDRRHFMRVKVNDEGKICSAGTQASHILSSFAEADGVVDVPSQTTLQPGMLVRILTWD